MPPMLNAALKLIFGDGDSDRRESPPSTIVNQARLQIAAPAERVFELLDPSQDGCRWRLRGDRIDVIDSAHGLFRLTDQRLPEAPFLMQVDRMTRPALIEMTIHGDGGAPIGAVAKSNSVYEIELTPGGCTVSLTERTHFVDGMAPRAFRRHSELMAKAVLKDLERLKAEAEEAPR